MNTLIIFLKHSDKLNRGKQWGRLKEQLEALKRDYKINSQVYDGATSVIEWVNEYDKINSSNYIEHLNKVKKLIGKYWKVSRMITRGETEESCEMEDICYLFPYDMNVITEKVFAIVSVINLNDFIFSKRRALGETYFDFVDLGNHISGDEGIIFEEVTEEEMLKNAQLKCEELFELRHRKMKEEKEFKGNFSV